MTDDKMLEKVRKLLSKAERAGSEHEAEAFTAKATELMLKYAIDEALLQQAGEKRDEKIVVYRVEVKGYAKAKMELMHRVARGLGLRAVHYTNSRSGWSTANGEVVGWESDVESFKVLFASLQMQATHEANRELKHLKENHPKLLAEYRQYLRDRDEWSKRYADFMDENVYGVRRAATEAHVAAGGSRYDFNIPGMLTRQEENRLSREWTEANPAPETVENPGYEPPHGRAFMQSFLIGYAGVVGSRLSAQRATLVKEAEQTAPGTAVAVRDRGEAVDQFFDQRHNPDSFVKGGRGASTSSNAGYYAGRSAGARANLGGQSIGGGRRAIGR